MGAVAVAEPHEEVVPHDFQAEASVLGALLLHPPSIWEVRNLLSSSDFYHQAHQIIFTVFEEMAEQGKPPDLTTLPDELRKRGLYQKAGQSAYICKLCDIVPTAANVIFYAGIVLEKSAQRQEIDLCRTHIRLAQQGGEAWNKSRHRIQDRFYELSLREEGEPQTEFSEDLLDIFNEGFTRDEVVECAGIRSSFPTLDYKINGLMPSDLILLGGRPSMGKTAMVTTIIQHVARQAPVDFFSLEQPKRQIEIRLYSAVSGLPAHTITRKVWTPEAKSAMDRAYRTMREWQVNIDPTNPITVGEMRRRLREQKAKRGLGVVLIDYAQIIDFAHSDIRQGMTLISKGIKGMAKEFEVPIILLSQLSRKCEERADKRPMLSDFKETGSFEADADVALGLYRPGYYEDVEPDPSLPQDAELIVLKNRNGPIGTVPLSFVADRTFFSERLGNGYGYD